MTRTYSFGFFKRRDCKGHCWICGYDPKDTMKKKTEKKNIILDAIKVYA